MTNGLENSSKRSFWKLSAAEITALCSFVVAFLSLVYSLNAQRYDRIYKETSIRPVIDLRLDPFALEVVNVGVGPAVIENTVIGYEDTCIDSGTGQTVRESWNVAVRALGEKISRELLSNILSELSTHDDYYKTAIPRADFLPNDRILGPSQGWYLVYISGFERPSEKPSPQFVQTYNKLSEIFPPKGVRLYYRAKYASLTGDFRSVSEISRGGMRCP